MAPGRSLTTGILETAPWLVCCTTGTCMTVRENTVNEQKETLLILVLISLQGHKMLFCLCVVLLSNTSFQS